MCLKLIGWSHTAAHMKCRDYNFLCKLAKCAGIFFISLKATKMTSDVCVDRARHFWHISQYQIKNLIMYICSFLSNDNLPTFSSVIELGWTVELGPAALTQTGTG